MSDDTGSGVHGEGAVICSVGVERRGLFFHRAPVGPLDEAGPLRSAGELNRHVARVVVHDDTGRGIFDEGCVAGSARNRNQAPGSNELLSVCR